jgi:hypothetical protein
VATYGEGSIKKYFVGVAVGGFNVFNRANFGNPSGSFSSAVFGQITSAMDPRIRQVALKFNF